VLQVGLRCLQVYQAMVQRGVRPSIATFGTLITAASDAGDLEAVQIVSSVTYLC
jgi:UDP:flavonoid glycosyltransferase YjiC (YdhE family)